MHEIWICAVCENTENIFCMQKHNSKLNAVCEYIFLFCAADEYKKPSAARECILFDYMLLVNEENEAYLKMMWQETISKKSHKKPLRLISTDFVLLVNYFFQAY